MVMRNTTLKLLKFALRKHPLEPGGHTRIFHSFCIPVIRCNKFYRPAASTRDKASNMYSSLETISRKLSSAPSTTKSSYDRNYITEERALNEFLLSIVDLQGLRVTVRRSANENDPPHKVYWRKDVEERAVVRWGSLEKVQIEREVRDQNEEESKFPVYKRYLMEKLKERERRKEEQLSRTRKNWPVRRLRFHQKDHSITGDSGRVVLSAIAINTGNFGIKLLAWAATGSHSMFSEAVHSLADTLNQVILAYGIHKSNSIPTKDHPYGYSNIQYVTALISGVGIFCLGAGLSVYHGITGLVSPHEMEGIWLALGILGVSFVSESVTLALAIKSIKKSALEQNMTFSEFVWSGWDPCVNVVLLEDLAAVAGVVIAGGCMSLSHYTGSHIPDAMGSLAIGGLLGSVASFMIYTNSGALVGRSIPDDRIEEINRELEGDIMVRQVYDVKGIDMGNGVVRYKAEIDFDGRELARSYLARKNMSSILEDCRLVENENMMEEFLLKHGEQMVDCLGAEVDRIERNLKAKHPEVRHVDLEVL